MANVSKQIEELKRTFKILVVLFALFILVPMFFGPLAIMYVESANNPKLNNYWDAFVYNYQVLVGVTITDAVVVTNWGKFIVGIFAFLNLVFFGFIAAIITTVIQKKILEKGYPQ